jgi:hypothetical protein
MRQKHGNLFTKSPFARRRAAAFARRQLFLRCRENFRKRERPPREMPRPFITRRPRNVVFLSGKTALSPTRRVLPELKIPNEQQAQRSCAGGVRTWMDDWTRTNRFASERNRGALPGSA